MQTSTGVTTPPETTIEAMLAQARAGLARLSPSEASDAVASGAVLVDIRSEFQQQVGGTIANAKHVPRNVLEWRLDPASPHRDHLLAKRDRAIILLCDEGHQSSLAAATLCRFGLQATDVIGGFQAWRNAGLPVLSPT